MTDFESIIYDEDDNEIPVTVEVTHYVWVEGNPNTWDSPDDYYGYEEFECRVWAGDKEIEVTDQRHAQFLNEYKRLLEECNA